MGRIATAVMVLIAMLWIPVVRARTASTTTCSRSRATWRRRSSSSSSSASSGSASTPKAASGPWSSASWSASSACWWTRPVTLKLKGFENGYTGGLVPLDRQQHQLPVLQHPDHARLRPGDGRRSATITACPFQNMVVPSHHVFFARRLDGVGSTTDCTRVRTGGVRRPYPTSPSPRVLRLPSATGWPHRDGDSLPAPSRKGSARRCPAPSGRVPRAARPESSRCTPPYATSARP
jgi:hypothetical protein